MIKLRELLSETSLRTNHGSVIRRYQNNVGKRVGTSLYVHRDYADQVIPKEILSRALEIITRSNPNFRFNSIMWDSARNVVRFDQAPDFDTASEPHVGDYIVVSLTRAFPPKQGHSNSIWHHKWLWVKDDYRGFDVDKSKEWSKLWLSKLNEPAKGSEIHWQSQLRNAGLTEGTQLVMEVTREEATMDFLKHMVANGPYKGQVFVAGGAVRDMVLGKKPKDVDVVVIDHGLRGGLEFTIWLAKAMGNFKGPEYPPKFNFPAHIRLDDYGAPEFTPIKDDPAFFAAVEEYEKYFASFSNPVIFPKFGTAKINLKGTFDGVSLDGMEVEAVCSRREEYTLGNRKPRVFPGTLKQDVFRRDFTTNSLMLDLTTGETLDLTGQGRDDIAAGVLRTPSDPDIIFKEDPLRMLRAVRFMVQKGWKISPETEAAIRKDAEWLTRISRERVRDELNKMLVTNNPGEAFRKMRELGLLTYIAPEFQQAVGMTQNVHHKHDVFDHTLDVLSKTDPEIIERLTALLHDIGKTATRSESPTGVHFYGHEDVGAEIADKIMRDLKYPAEMIDAVKAGVKNHMRLKHGGDDAVKLTDKSLRKFKIDLGKNLATVLKVIHADNIAHADASAMPNQIENVRKRLEKLDIQVTKPNLPINGNDLLAMGVKSGPAIGRILSAVTDAWFGNPNITREEAIAIAQKML